VHTPAGGRDYGWGMRNCPYDAPQLVVSHDLLEAEFDVGKDRQQVPGAPRSRPGSRHR